MRKKRVTVTVGNPASIKKIQISVLHHLSLILALQTGRIKPIMPRLQVMDI